MNSKELFPLTGLQPEREVLLFLYSDKPMISINLNSDEDFRLSPYFGELSQYLNINVGEKVPKFFKNNSVLKRHLEYLHNRSNMKYEEIMIENGIQLGYPPSATHAMLESMKKKDAEQVWVDYYRLIFRTAFPSLSEDISWIDTHYHFPKELQTWITVSRDTHSTLNHTVSSKILVYSKNKMSVEPFYSNVKSKLPQIKKIYSKSGEKLNKFHCFFRIKW